MQLSELTIIMQYKRFQFLLINIRYFFSVTTTLYLVI